MSDLREVRELLLECAVNHRWFTRNGTRLTKAAYRKGAEAEGNGHTLDDCPYGKKRSLPNFMRGHNDPREAWTLGWHDSARVRRMLNDPSEDFPGLLFSEAKALSDAGLLTHTETVVVGSTNPVEMTVKDFAVVTVQSAHKAGHDVA